MSVVLRAAIECAFLLLQYRLFGFRVPELYKCRVSTQYYYTVYYILYLGESLSKYSRLLLVTSDRKNDIYSFHVWYHTAVHVFKFYGINLPRVALDCPAPSQTAR